MRLDMSWNIMPGDIIKPYLPRYQSSWGRNGAHLGPVGPRWAPYWPHDPFYLGNHGICTLFCKIASQRIYFVAEYRMETLFCCQLIPCSCYDRKIVVCCATCCSKNVLQLGWTKQILNRIWIVRRRLETRFWKETWEYSRISVRLLHKYVKTGSSYKHEYTSIIA